MMAAGIIPLNAQTNAERIQSLEDNIAVIRSSVDSISADITASLSEMEETVDKINSSVDDLRERMEDNGGRKSNHADFWRFFGMKWVCLLLFAVFLPLLLAKLYLNKSKEDQRRYDIIVDLIRSGVEIKPEMLEYLTGTNTRSGQTIHSGALSGMNQTDVNYCSKRLLWAVCLLVIGFTIAMISNEGIVFGIFACVAVIFAAQAVVRYFSVKYFNQHKDVEQKKDAE